MGDLGWEDPLEKRKATHSSILAWRIPWTVLGVAKSQTQLSDFYFHFLFHKTEIDSQTENKFKVSKGERKREGII